LKSDFVIGSQSVRQTESGGGENLNAEWLLQHALMFDGSGKD
jgi:hypothetical protein